MLTALDSPRIPLPPHSVSNRSPLLDKMNSKLLFALLLLAFAGAACARKLPSQRHKPTIAMANPAPQPSPELLAAAKNRFIVVYKQGTTDAAMAAARSSLTSQLAGAAHAGSINIGSFSADVIEAATLDASLPSAAQVAASLAHSAASASSAPAETDAISPAAAGAAAAPLSSIAYIEPDSITAATATTAKCTSGCTSTVCKTCNPASWGLDRVDQTSNTLDAAYSYYPSAGKGGTVYVLDTGVNTALTDFQGRATFLADLTGAGVTTDDNGHGE